MENDKSNTDNANSNSRPLSIQAPPANVSRLPIQNQPRQPSDLQGLLRFAMEATKDEDAPHQSNVQTLDEEVKIIKNLNSFIFKIYIYLTPYFFLYF